MLTVFACPLRVETTTPGSEPDVKEGIMIKFTIINSACYVNLDVVAGLVFAVGGTC
jgi:hypothetical protein